MISSSPFCRWRSFLAACLVFVASAAGVSAQETGTVRLVVPFAPGGTNDIFSRVLADRLHTKLDRTVIVENRPGGGGIIAARAVITAPPDGETMLVSSASIEIQSAKQEPPFDVLTDLTPVMLTYTGAHTLYVNAKLPIQSLQDLIGYEHAHPGALSYGSFGIGSQVQLAFEMLNAQAGMHLVHIPYRSNSETLTAVSKNEVQLSLEPYKTLKSHIDSGDVRAIAVTSRDRDANAPDLPTLSEAGVKDFNIVYWSGIQMPGKTPAAIVAAYNKALNDCLKDPEVITLMERLGVRAVGGSAEDFRAFIAADIAPLKDLIRTLDIKFD